MKPAEKTLLGVDAEASEVFVQRLQGEWTPKHQADLEGRLSNDRAFAQAYARVEQSWSGIDKYGETPEIMGYREEAMAYARRANARRWRRRSSYAPHRWRLAAVLAVVAVALGVAWQLSPYGYTPGQYRTGIGEQRIVELADHSRIALDAATSLQVRYTKDARIVELRQGQAQFSVAHDPGRPFKVVAGDRTIVAVGTVFTVEFMDRQIHVAMMEGRVAVLSQGNPRSASTTSSGAEPSKMGEAGAVELSAGEELRVSREGRTILTPQADLEAATAWREGKVIFRTEPLGEAVRRVNRYSRVQIVVADEALAARHISGVFEAGDTEGFLSAIERYLPVTADSTESDRIVLRSK